MPVPKSAVAKAKPGTEPIVNGSVNRATAPNGFGAGTRIKYLDGSRWIFGVDDSVEPAVLKLDDNTVIRTTHEVLLAGIAALAAAPATAQTIAITGGRVVVGDGSPPVDGGTVVIRDGRVVAAGAGVSVPAGATVVDASGKWVTPGIVAGFSSLGTERTPAAQAPTATKLMCPNERTPELPTNT